MPVKKRADKSRKLDEYKFAQLIHGPDHWLLAGVGYCAPGTLTIYGNASEAEQGAILIEMRADWQRHRKAILSVANGTPWAQTQFEGTENDKTN